MSITGVLIAALIVGGTGLFIGIFLGVAGKKFAIEVDEKEAQILEALPGNKVLNGILQNSFPWQPLPLALRLPGNPRHLREEILLPGSLHALPCCLPDAEEDG